MRKTLVCALSLGAVACDAGGSTEPATAGVAGTYRLATFDGRRLPTPTGAAVDGASARLVSGTLVLDADGRCRFDETIVVRDASGRSRTETSHAVCAYEDLGAGRLDLRFVDGVIGGGFVQAVSYAGGTVAYLNFHHAREYRRTAP